MLTKITFRNFRAIQDASIELGPFKVLIGPHGSGKLQAIRPLGRVAEAQAILDDSLLARIHHAFSVKSIFPERTEVQTEATEPNTLSARCPLWAGLRALCDKNSGQVACELSGLGQASTAGAIGGGPLRS